MESVHRLVIHSIKVQIDLLSREAVDRQYALQPELWKRYGLTDSGKSVRDAAYHLTYLAEAISVDDPSLFEEYIVWLKYLFTGLNFPDDALYGALESMGDVLRKYLPSEQYAIAQSYLESAWRAARLSLGKQESYLLSTSPYHELARNYMNALLQGNRYQANQMILSAVQHGTSIKDIYLEVFQPCQQEIGRLWQTNQVSVAQEHFSTAATQLIMSQLYPYIFATPKTGNRLVACSVGGELHEIGMRMVADFLEMDGWDTYYLGANSPLDSVVQAVENRNANILAISATIPIHVSKVSQIINLVRSKPNLSSIKIMVGGYPFKISSGLWCRVGADGYARNAQEAVQVANDLVVSRQ